MLELSRCGIMPPLYSLFIPADTPFLQKQTPAQMVQRTDSKKSEKSRDKIWQDGIYQLA